jgi:hypothetical protein
MFLVRFAKALISQSSNYAAVGLNDFDASRSRIFDAVFITFFFLLSISYFDSLISSSGASGRWDEEALQVVKERRRQKRKEKEGQDAKEGKTKHESKDSCSLARILASWK